MRTEVANLGEELREEREARDLSLGDVGQSLGVPVHYLEAMEGADSPLVADAFYIVPFLRRYAEFLGKDPATCVARYLAEVVRKEKQPSPRVESPPSIPTGWIVGGAVVAAAAGALAWFVLL